MAYEITVGPAQLAINTGECVLITETDGQIGQPSERGLFYRDTRLISEWSVEVDGQPSRLISSAATSHFAAQAVLTNPVLQTDGGEVPAQTVSLTVSRMLDRGGMRETLVLRNQHRADVRLQLAIRFRCDFADIFDVKSHRLVSRGDTASTWSPKEGRLETVHVNQTFRRGVSVAPAAGSPKPGLRDGALHFVAVLAPQAEWQAELLYQVVDGDKILEASPTSYVDRGRSPQEKAAQQWRSQAMRLQTSCTQLQLLYDCEFTLLPGEPDPSYDRPCVIDWTCRLSR